jgi:tocopherol cyclase
MKLFHPEVFQGNLTSEKYFEGWYFKHVNRELDQVYAFIPGISLNKINPHAFVQVINGITGKTSYIEYPLERFSYHRKSLFVKVGDSTFTDKYIDLNINNGSEIIKGYLEYSDSISYPSSVFSPGIMGWYSFVPMMECKHGVVSVNHKISGKVILNGKTIDFSGGKGYIEKDWGKSFPEAWIWVQSNNFTLPDASLMISIAKIPWLGSFFTGFLGFLYFEGNFYTFSTYNGSKISALSYKNKELLIRFDHGEHKLNLIVNHFRSGELKAPVLGRMDRIIKESIDSEIRVELVNKAGKILFNDTGKRAGSEIIEKIFDNIKF